MRPSPPRASPHATLRAAVRDRGRHRPARPRHARRRAAGRRGSRRRQRHLRDAADRPGTRAAATSPAERQSASKPAPPNSAIQAKNKAASIVGYTRRYSTAYWVGTDRGCRCATSTAARSTARACRRRTSRRTRSTVRSNGTSRRKRSPIRIDRAPGRRPGLHRAQHRAASTTTTPAAAARRCRRCRRGDHARRRWRSCPADDPVPACVPEAARRRRGRYLGAAARRIGSRRGYHLEPPERRRARTRHELTQAGP